MTKNSDAAPAVVEWSPRPLASFAGPSGRHVAISTFSAERDAADFVAGLCGPGDATLWRHIPFEPFTSAANVAEFFAFVAEHDDWIPYVFRRPDDGRLIGTASHLRIRSDAGSAEVGLVVFSPAMQRSAAATEAMYLLARQVFGESGYRRYEWKCDAANEASKRAARRLGFTFEGVFRQDMVVKGRNRDTAWFSMLDHEWPAARRAFEAWLAPANFDAHGAQKVALATLRDAARD